MKIIRYVVKADTGLAPNPFHGWCTLAVCTPNHQGAKVDVGDWIVGNSERPKDGSDSDRLLIYAMRVDEVLTMDQYFNDPRFQAKKPNPYGNPEEQCGDNLYFKDPKTNTWRRLSSMFHNHPSWFFKDLGENLSGSEVFVGSEFYYFGKKAQKFPHHFKELIATGRGIRNYGDVDLFQQFIDWLKENHEHGRLGEPTDITDQPVTESMVTSYRFGYNETWSDLHQQGSCRSVPSPQPEITRSTGCSPARKKQEPR